MQAAIYLFFNGNCEEAMNFYKDALGGSLDMVSRYKDAPEPCAEDQKEKIMHAVLHAAGSIIFFSDCNEAHKTTFGDNFSISLDFKSDSEIEATFAAISAGGTTTMPLQDTFWGAKFGMCKDKFGVNWMVNYDKPKA